mmetsp:Transcript_37094/g.82518  ORF Transcript_37094/g.82518 Transcript_37094/m.82518 type:complete len:153 (+) Transcript_37094:541-999(+)
MHEKPTQLIIACKPAQGLHQCVGGLSLMHSHTQHTADPLQMLPQAALIRQVSVSSQVSAHSPNSMCTRHAHAQVHSNAHAFQESSSTFNISRLYNNKERSHIRDIAITLQSQQNATIAGEAAGGCTTRLVTPGRNVSTCTFNTAGGDKVDLS